MKKQEILVHKFTSISALHAALGFPKPLHPLVSLVNYADIKLPYDQIPRKLALDFYKISYKKSLSGKIRYGQGYYDFDEGGLAFIAPNQIISGTEEDKDYTGFTLLFHPDFIRHYPLGSRIRSFGFFSYEANEALFLSDKERQIIFSVFENIKSELENSIDDFSQPVIVALLDVLLNYSSRFYKRQFITRNTLNNDLLVRIEHFLQECFDTEESLATRLPTVESLASYLNFSPRYLSDMLRSLTGKNAQQHIHDRLIEKSKEFLTTTDLSVSEIAYQLGFQQPQSFSKFFKKKTRQTPIEYKQSFN
jgi:AraC family transcriptional activator of pobA